MHNLIISAPFGNYLNFPNTTSTLGTYTLEKRAGVIKRWWKIFSTVRYNWSEQSWRNKLGLPCPSVRSLKGPCIDKILSIHGFSEREWYALSERAKELAVEAVEFNLSCPNLDSNIGIERLIEDISGAVKRLLRTGMKVIAKLAPIRWIEIGKRLWDLGIRCFHLCNTIKTPGGGKSGKPLMQYSLWAIEDFRTMFGEEVELIGGGGVTSAEDVLTYKRAGANRVAIGSCLFNPFNWHKVKDMVIASY